MINYRYVYYESIMYSSIILYYKLYFQRTYECNQASQLTLFGPRSVNGCSKTRITRLLRPRSPKSHLSSI